MTEFEQSPQVNKIEDDSTSSHLEFEESSGATTVEGESRDECNDCSSHCVERNIIQVNVEYIYILTYEDDHDPLMQTEDNIHEPSCYP